MIRRWYCELGFGAELMLIVHERLVVASQQQITDARLKRNRPIVRLGSVAPPSIGMQIVDDVAAAENENALFAQGREAFADIVVE